MPKFIELCMSENRKLQKNLRVFVEKAFKIRTQMLYRRFFRIMEN